MKIIIAILLFLCFPASQTPMSRSVSDSPLTLLGAKVKVTDMGKALAFYGDVLGYRVMKGDEHSSLVVLENDGMAFVLEKATYNRKTAYPDETQTILVFQANDLERTTSDLEQKGVSFYYETPEKVGVGYSNKFFDPFGNLHSLLAQTVVETPFFEEPRIYNIGYYIPDIEAGRQFYSAALGLPIRTLHYYPPALPLNDTQGNFCIMLHERKGIRPVQLNYPEDTQTVIMFKTPDIDTLIGQLDAKGIQPIRDIGVDQLGKFTAFRDPFGNIMEVYERE